ncbi:MAG: hypothetical protein KA187_06595 [Arenimonas sp.]|nr:hypothetical protein [Arenimonas sp.]
MKTLRRVSPVLLSLALGLPAAAAAQGHSPDFRVQLDPTTCQFSGGSDGAGNVEVDSGTGNKMIQVMLSPHQGYSIEPVEFSGPGADQMIASGGGNARVVNIFNRNSGPADVKYSVSVRNDETGEVKPCDPRIINR